MRAVRLLLLTLGSAGLASCGGGAAKPTTVSSELQVAAACQYDWKPDQVVRVSFRVIDTSDHPINLGDVTVRYHLSYNDHDRRRTAFSLRYLRERGAITDYFTAFSGDVRRHQIRGDGRPAGALRPCRQRTVSESPFTPADFSPWDVNQADDYSFVACGTDTPAPDLVPRPTMPAYVGGKLAWGVEPREPC